MKNEFAEKGEVFPFDPELYASHLESGRKIVTSKQIERSPAFQAKISNYLLPTPGYLTRIWKTESDEVIKRVFRSAPPKQTFADQDFGTAIV